MDVWWNNAVLSDFVPDIMKYADVIDFQPSNIDIFAYAPTFESQIAYESAVNDIFNEYTAKIIVGELPVDAVDEMFEKADASGYLEIEKEQADWYWATGRDMLLSLAAK